jgi:hypothetical protein
MKTDGRGDPSRGLGSEIYRVSLGSSVRAGLGAPVWTTGGLVEVAVADGPAPTAPRPARRGPVIGGGAGGAGVGRDVDAMSGGGAAGETDAEAAGRTLAVGNATGFEAGAALSEGYAGEPTTVVGVARSECRASTATPASVPATTAPAMTAIGALDLLGVGAGVPSVRSVTGAAGPGGGGERRTVCVGGVELAAEPSNARASCPTSSPAVGNRSLGSGAVPRKNHGSKAPGNATPRAAARTVAGSLAPCATLMRSG